MKAANKSLLLASTLLALALAGCSQRPSNAELAAQLDANYADFSAIVDACAEFPMIPGVIRGGSEATVESSPELRANGVAAYNKAHAAMIKLQLDRADCLRDDQKPDHPLLEVTIAKVYRVGDESVEQVFLYRAAPPDTDFNPAAFVALKHQGWYLTGNGLVK